MVFAIGKYELWFIIVAIKYLLENMYCRYIIGAKKIIKKKLLKKKKKTTYASVFKSAGIGLLNFIHSRPIPALLEAGA